ncbi:MAG TPA: sigma-54 dependent transcriptional regulator [Blastocatellia bacterium]|nr:sigma-54 dependent transcriptional regulator [Blastocatellia bacterium]
MSLKIRVLLVDDDPVLRKVVPTHLMRSGFVITAAESGHAALEELRRIDYDVVLLDVKMPGLSGIEVLQEIRQLDDPPEVIMLTADLTLTTGLEAMRRGAYDYLTKPATLEEMEAVIRKAEEKRRLIRQNAALRAIVRRPLEENIPAIAARSAIMTSLLTQAKTAAMLDTTILLQGESGVGKDVLARFLHTHSPRADAPMITVNCGALPDTLFESEFFGHERGAFTGASTLKRGLLEAANESTLFLDEVGEMPLAAQVKLLRFLEQGFFRRIGATQDRRSDVRIIAATNRQLLDEVRAGRFRADLFYRLNVISFQVPPLRERREDIPALLEHFLELYRKRFHRPALTLSPDARQQLENYDWPGNVRELRNCLERAAALSTCNLIEAAQVLPSLPTSPSTASSPLSLAGTEHITLAELERSYLLHILEEVGGDRERAAVLLGISSRTIYRKLREYEESTGNAAIFRASAIKS